MDQQQNTESLTSLFDPYQYLKTIEELENFKCVICFEVPIDPVRCKKCRVVFCLPCANKQKQSKNICVYRCYEFMIETCPNFSSVLKCPYSSSCLAEIANVQQFDNHIIVCEYATEQLRKGVLNRKFYRCLKGEHPLEFMISTYEEMLEGKCSLCKEKKLVRSICRKCEEIFCVTCRPVPITKGQCPIGHKFKEKKLTYMSYICDICNISVSLTGDYVYDDHKCNFGICSRCISKVPQKLHESVKWIVNEPEYCQFEVEVPEKKVHHELRPYKSSQKFQCQLCLKQVKAGQKCPACPQSKYCFQCKPYLAEETILCRFNHKIHEKKAISQMVEEGQQIQAVQCDRCSSNLNNTFFEDEECRVIFCQDCLDYGIKILSERERPLVSVECSKNHTLNFSSASLYFIGKCRGCLQFKIIKYFCGVCKPSGMRQLYCCGCCLPPDINLCYFGHPMNFIENSEQMEEQLKLHDFFENKTMACHLCSHLNESSQMYRCRKCNINYCLECVSSLKQDKPIKTSGITQEMRQMAMNKNTFLA